MGYTQAALRGISWLTFLRMVVRAMTFVRIAILARLLTPAMFGLFGITTLVQSLLEILTETGINIILIQKKDDIHKYIDTAWVISIVRGILMTVIIFFGAGWVGNFFNSPSVISLIQLIAIVPFLRGFINPSIVYFQKNLTFGKEFFYRSTIFFVESITAILLAFVLKSATALVIGMIAGAFYEVLLSWVMVSPRPRFILNKNKLLEVFHRGKWLTLTGIFSYFYQNGDNIVVGKLLGPGFLGIYDMGYKISMIPISEISDIFTRATFPILTRIREDRKRFIRAYVKTIALVMGIAVAITIVLWIYPEQIVRIILGDKWLSVIPVLRILAILGTLRGLAASLLAPLYALEKQNLVTFISFLTVVGMFSIIIPLTNSMGIIGAAVAAIFGSVIVIPAIIFVMYRYIFHK